MSLIQQPDHVVVHPETKTILAYTFHFLGGASFGIEEEPTQHVTVERVQGDYIITKRDDDGVVEETIEVRSAQLLYVERRRITLVKRDPKTDPVKQVADALDAAHHARQFRIRHTPSPIQA